MSDEKQRGRGALGHSGRPPHPATVVQPKVVFGGMAKAAPHPATVQAKGPPPHPAKRSQMQPRGALAAQPKPRAPGPMIVQRQDSLLYLTDEEAEWITQGPTFWELKFTINVKGGKLLEDSQTTHADHHVECQRESFAYSVDTWMNDKHGFVAKIQRGFVDLCRELRVGLPDVTKLAYDLTDEKTLDAPWLDTILKKFVIESASHADWYARTQFTIVPKSRATGPDSPTVQLMVHLILLRVSFHYRDSQFAAFGEKGVHIPSFMSYLASRCINVPNGLSYLLSGEASGTKGSSQTELTKLSKQPKALTLVQMLEIPRTKQTSGYIWNAIVCYLMTEKMGPSSGEYENSNRTAACNHVRIRLYAEWRAFFELWMALVAAEGKTLANVL